MDTIKLTKTTAFFPIVLLLLLVSGKFVQAGSGSDEKFDPAEMIIHHVTDDYEWHVAGDFTIPLPVILYSPQTGLDVFLSSKFDHGKVSVNGYEYDHGHLSRTDGAAFYDFSITKNVFGMLTSLVIILLLFTGAAKSYAARKGQAPKGLQSFLEPLILFVRDDIAKASIGEKKYLKFTPYLLTLFFFIWINNLLGLIPIFPGGANVTGNINVTFTLAFLTLILVNINGSKHYWAHIFWPPGVPVPLKLPLALIEFVGIFSKPFALMIRLFANITAGHIIILSIIGLVFLLKETLGAGAFGVGVVSVLFALFMNCLELLVAALQAYIFTVLTALFIGQAVEEPQHH